MGDLCFDDAEWERVHGSLLKAITLYRKASENQPDRAEIYWRIANCYFHLHLWVETKKALEKAAQMDPKLVFQSKGPENITIADLEKLINAPPLTKKESDRLARETYKKVMKNLSH